jgi:hypothetical protein
MDDLERNEYTAVNGDEQSGKVTEFELGEMSDEDEDNADEDNADAGESSSSTPPSPGRDRQSIENRRDEDLNVAGDGELSEIIIGKGKIIRKGRHWHLHCTLRQTLGI